MEIVISLSAVVLTALLGIVAYSIQKSIDRRNSLNDLRKERYRMFIEAFQTGIEFSTEEKLAAYHVAYLLLILVASNEVLRAAGALNVYMARTSVTAEARASRTRKEFDPLLISLIKEMRLDCFEKTNLTDEEISRLLPFQ